VVACNIRLQGDELPSNWDNSLPSDVALKLPGNDEPAILLCDMAEVDRAGFDLGYKHALIFCSNLKKAHEYFRRRNVAPDPIQEGGGTQFFEIRDPEGNVIEICKEP
jgi:hypothetical protein